MALDTPERLFDAGNFRYSRDNRFSPGKNIGIVSKVVELDLACGEMVCWRNC